MKCVWDYVWGCELEAEFDARANFYGKAKVKAFHNSNGIALYELYSYGSLVLVILKDLKDEETYKIFRMKDERLYSMTTLRHCREFIRQFGDMAERLSKKEILKLDFWG